MEEIPIRVSWELCRIIKKTVSMFGVFVFLALVVKPTYANAEENVLTIGSVLKYTAGIATSALVHEGSHALVAGLTGTHLDWEAGTYNQPIGFTDHANSDAKGVAIYSAGLLSQAISGEIILDVDKIDKNDAFVRGMMTWNVLNPILYSLDYWVFHVSNQKSGSKYQGDLTGIEHYSNQAVANGFALSMTAIAVFQGYRFIKTQTWAPDWLKSNFNNVNLSPMRSGGFMLTYKSEF
jgi:hypothetical protein